MENNTDIEYHRNVLKDYISRLTDIIKLLQVSSVNILAGYSYITTDIGFKLDNSNKDPQFLKTQYNMFKIYLNGYIQLISDLIPTLQHNHMVGLTLLNKLSKQIVQIGTPEFGLIDENNMTDFDLSNIINSDNPNSDTSNITQHLLKTDIDLTEHKNIISLPNKIDISERFETIIDPTQKETTDTTKTFTEHHTDIDDIIIEKNNVEEKNIEETPEEVDFKVNSDDKNIKLTEIPTDKAIDLSTTTTDKSNVSSSETSKVDYSIIYTIKKHIDCKQQRNIFLEEHPDEIINQYYHLHEGPQMTNIIINDDTIIWNGDKEKNFVNIILQQIIINPEFSAHDIYRLLIANLLPNYVSIAHIYDKYTQDYLPHLTKIEDQLLIKLSFKSIMLSYMSNDNLFNEQRAYEILTEWNDAFHELSF